MILLTRNRMQTRTIITIPVRLLSGYLEKRKLRSNRKVISLVKCMIEYGIKIKISL